MPTLPPVKDPGLLSGLTLAYVGDAIFELYVRQGLLARSHNPHTLNALGRTFVNHRAQADLYDAIASHVSVEDAGVLRRGRNARGIVPKKGDPEAYRKATALEALVGYYYLCDRKEDLLWLLGHMEILPQEGEGL